MSCVESYPTQDFWILRLSNGEIFASGGHKSVHYYPSGDTLTYQNVDIFGIFFAAEDEFCDFAHSNTVHFADTK